MSVIDERRAGFQKYKDDVKTRGKPFYPYAMFHDTVMSLVVVSVIIGLIGLHLYLVVRLGVTSPPWSREAAGADWLEEQEVSTDGQRAGLTRPSARSAWRRNGGDAA